MDVPPCVVSADPDGRFNAYVDVHITRSESTVELIRCWGGPSSTSDSAEDEASHKAVKKLAQELDLHVKDYNYDEALFYKNLSDQLSANFSTFSNQYNKLVWEYNFIKERYIASTTEKNELIADRLRIQHAIECSSVISRYSPPAAITATPVSEITSPPLG